MRSQTWPINAPADTLLGSMAAFIVAIPSGRRRTGSCAAGAWPGRVADKEFLERGATRPGLAAAGPGTLPGAAELGPWHPSLIQYPRDAAKIDSRNEKNSSGWAGTPEHAPAARTQPSRIPSFHPGRARAAAPAILAIAGLRARRTGRGNLTGRRRYRHSASWLYCLSRYWPRESRRCHCNRFHRPRQARCHPPHCL
jgi:hypothetical protein